MTQHTKSARARADAEFAKVQSQAREREKAREARDEAVQARDENTAKLRALRLARDAADRGEK